VHCQICDGMSQYDPCSTSGVCGCFHRSGNNDNSICGFLWLTCSELVSCEFSNNMCYQPDHICVHHPRCYDRPVCYPLSKAHQQICPPIISETTKWSHFFRKKFFFAFTVTNVTTTSTTTISRDFNLLFNMISI
jgi:hypothetical protein